MYTVFQQRGVEHFAIVSSDVNLWKFLNFWKQQRIIYTINIIFLAIS